MDTDANEELTPATSVNNAIEKPKVLTCTHKVHENRSTFEMYLSTSTNTLDFSEMYLSAFRVLHKFYLSTDVLKGSFTIIDIYESVHSVRFLMTPSPSRKA